MGIRREANDIIIKKDPEARRKLPKPVFEGSAYSLIFYGTEVDIPIPITNTEPVTVEMSVDRSEIRFTLPEELPLKSQPKTKPVPVYERQDWRDAVSGLHGASAVIALESNRLGSRQKAIAFEQLISLLEMAGHRVQKINPRLFWLDDRCATLSDLVERAAKIDQECVLVADAT